MATTEETRPSTGATKSRESARGGARAAQRTSAARPDAREEQFDLLTAALIGMAVGAGAALLLRRGPGGTRPLGPALRIAGRGARLAGAAGMTGAAWAGKHGARGARWAAERGEELWDRVPTDEIRSNVAHYAEAAREAIDEAVENEVRDIKRAIRRQRKRIGI